MAAENYERALPWAERWFESANSKQRKHYDTLNILYEHLALTGKRRNLLLVMAEKWPNDKSIQRQFSSPSENAPRQSVDMLPNVINPRHVNYGNFKIAVSDRDAQPIVRIPPVLPVTATASRYCRLRFDVTVEGQPINVETKSCTPLPPAQPSRGVECELALCRRRDVDGGETDRL